MPSGNGPPRDAAAERAQKQPRGKEARFTRDPEAAKRDAEACDLRTKGWTYRRIAAHFGVDGATAYRMIERALQEIVREPAETLRTLLLERLDAELVRLNELEEITRAILERHHVTVSNGQVVRLNGDPILDDAPVLQAVDRMLKIDEQRRKNDESRRKLLGTDAPSRVSVEAEQLGREISRLLDATLGPDGAGDDPDA